MGCMRRSKDAIGWAGGKLTMIPRRKYHNYMARHNFHHNNTANSIQKKSSSRYIHYIRLYMKEFFQETTIHGFRYLVLSNRHPLEILLWALAVGVAFIAAIVLVIGSWERFSANPTVVSLEKNYREWQTLFPAFTMCYLENVNQTRAEELVLQIWGPVENMKKKYYLEFLNTLANISLGTLHEFEKYKNDISLGRIIDLEDLAYKVQIDLSYEVRYMDGESKVRLRPTLTEVGLCFTWGSLIAHHFDTRTAFEPVQNHTQVTPCNFSDLPCGIRVFELPTNVKFYVHSPSEMPTHGRSKPQFEFRESERQVNVMHLQTIASPELRRLLPYQRRCLFEDETDYYHKSLHQPQLPIYTYNLCKMACRIRLAKKLCDCIPFFYRTLGEGKICDVKGMTCLSTIKQNLTEVVYDSKRCNCFQQCEITDFNIDMEKTLQLQSVYGTQNKVQFHIGIERYSKTRLKRDVIFSFEDLLVSFGGTVSLFLGCSILSAVELVYFFTLRPACKIWMAYQKHRRTDRLPKPRHPNRPIQLITLW